MTQVPLEGLVKFLHDLESLEVPPITIAKLTMNADPRNLMVMKDVQLSIKTVKAKAGGKE
jgi:hypothetical protein